MTDLPLGRAVDIVVAAATAAGLTARTVSISGIGYSSWLPELTLHTDSRHPRNEATARAVFARLGIADVTVRPGSSNHSAVEADLHLLGVRLVVVIELVTEPEPIASAEEVAALVAEVDERRAAAEAEPCRYTHAHTRDWCGNSTCRES